MDNNEQELKEQGEIEPSRKLWIILSVLAVFLIVFAVALLWFAQSDKDGNGQSQLGSYLEKNDEGVFDINEYVHQDEGFPGMNESSPVDEEFSATSGDSGNNTTETDGTTVELAEENDPADDDSEVQEVSQQNRTEVKNTEKPAPVQSQPVQKQQQTMKVRVTVYWIQVGSYNDEMKAKEVRDFLLTKDISSEIQATNVYNKTHYRVRIGAYQSMGEADRFVNEIKTLKGFKDSYVVQTTMVKEVPVN